MSVVSMVRGSGLSLALLACVGCAVRPGLRIAGQAGLELRGLGPCDGSSGPLTLDPHRPVVVLVHGCHASAARFRSLAQVFALHGQQAACFEYDDRARIRRSARALRTALEDLSAHLDAQELVVLGHSQGGLVARAALTGEPLHTPASLRLVTVSSPFNGIAAAKDCGSRLLHIATLGVTVGVCRVATGAKWSEIHPLARGVLQPEKLASNVSAHLRVVTDERNTCRTFAAHGQACLQDDFVFTSPSRTTHGCVAISACKPRKWPPGTPRSWAMMRSSRSSSSPSCRRTT